MGSKSASARISLINTACNSEQRQRASQVMSDATRCCRLSVLSMLAITVRIASDAPSFSLLLVTFDCANWHAPSNMLAPTEFACAAHALTLRIAPHIADV